MFERLPCELARVRLRAMRRADVAAFHAYRCDPEVARFQGWSSVTRQQASEFVETQSRHHRLTPDAWHQLAIADRASDALIGDAGIWLSPDGLQAGIGLSIGSAAQGRGYGAECLNGLIDLLFSATPVLEIIGNVDARNAACLAAVARTRMCLIGTRQVHSKGEACMEHAFSIRKPHAGDSPCS